MDAEGLLAIVVQHEVDHLKGMLIFDRLSSLKRDLIKRKLRKRAES
jgi:peptide deformylase